MIIIMNPKASKENIEKVKTIIREKGLDTNVFKGHIYYIIGIIGDTSIIDSKKIEVLEGVDRVMKVREPFKKANRMFKPEDTIIEVNGSIIGGKHLGIIAGSCSIESEEQIVKIAKRVKTAGANFLRGGAFKPRTSPYSFQGLELEGLKFLKTAKHETGLPIVTELMSTDYIDTFVEEVDIIQIGARNMQNFDLLKQIGKTNKPILLKRGLSATIEEWLMSAEYIMAGGNENVILCERGVRTFETITRNTLDLQAIPVIKKLSHLPIIIDPSHAGGYAYLVEPMAKAAITAGSDGLMIEVHNDPENALSDGQQSLTPDEFDGLMDKIKIITSLESKEIQIYNNTNRMSSITSLKYNFV
ncbi:phospho-2-dehydro-3-deoxyheptonate aldolase [Clostridium puniceum]|uniref:Phospho-2-dehydro-3-deoxyheptonate aldolase n=1 Tax=Clostridium puniceum TaxID=29367 RepID=A0A1S8T7A3_9CLOT|nr:3-deoxy-7-phosphoheptulonate synthase [Clostridium puniceum]OOM73626.1 phospho-2-dehydro-3-deoxyheptonate aldolase [Clostridium puniceum]